MQLVNFRPKAAMMRFLSTFSATRQYGEPATAQQLLHARSGARITLWALTVLAAVSAAHAFLKENAIVRPNGAAWLWELKLLDLNEGLTITVAMLSLLVVHQQFVLGTRPYLIYTSGWREGSIRGLTSDASNPRVWRVTTRNVGPGLAVVRSVTLRFAPSRELRPSVYNQEYHSVINKIEQHDLVAGQHFILSNMSPGMAIGPGKAFVLFEILATHVSRIYVLDLQIRFDGILGDQFVKEVILMPLSDTEQG